MDIKSGNGYPASALSNFAPHPFVFDGVKVNSMEGFLQSLKFKDFPVQVEVCKLVGLAAKRRGSKKRWQTRQTLYWRGLAYKREDPMYQELLTMAYEELFKQSESFRNALKATGDAYLEHSIGRSNPKETVLTRSEFCGRLMKLRAML